MMIEKEVSKNKKNQNIISKFLWFWTNYSVIVAFFIIVIIVSIINKDFLTRANIINIIRQASIIGIISLGMSFVILIGGIDLSVGSVLALIGGISLLILNKTGNILITILCALLLGAIIGLINGLLITKGKITPFIVTLGIMASARSLILYISKGGSISGKVPEYINIANGEIASVAYPIFIFIFLTIIMIILSQKTRFGRYVYAIGSNEKAALLSAINTDKIKILVYMICSTLTALAAIIESSRLNSISSASSGISYELDAIAGVIIGGTRMSGGKGKILGTFFGILILGALNNILNLMNVSPYLQGLVKGLIIITAVLMQKKE